MQRWFAVLLIALVGCKDEDCAEAPASVTVRLGGEVVMARSVEVRVAYDDVVRTFPRNVDGTVENLVIGLVPPPQANTSATITVALYANEDGRGARVAQGEAIRDVTPDGCNEVEVALARPVPSLDGGVGNVRDAGPNEEPDAGAALEDAGVIGACDQSRQDTSTLLYSFEQLPMLLDETELTKARYIPIVADLDPVGVPGPNGCGTAIEFDGQGVMQVDGEGLLVDNGDLSFWVRFDGEPGEAQGIVSRDATGQAEPGHFTVFRSCEDRIVVRMQDLNQSVYRCSTAPVPPGRWVDVRIGFGQPNLALYVDGELQDGVDEVPLLDVDCVMPIPCGGELAEGLGQNGLPMAVGASLHQSVPGGPEPYTMPFFGAVDVLHVQTR